MAKNTTGKRLKELRTSQKLTQKALAEEFGIRQDDISRYENDNQELSLHMLKAYCKRFHKSSDYILGISKDVADDNTINFIRNYTGLSKEAINALHDYITGFSFIDFQEYWNNSNVKEDGDHTKLQKPKNKDLFEKMDVINFFMGFNPEDDDIDEYFKRFTRIIYGYHNGITENIRLKKEFIPQLRQHIEQLKADIRMDSMPYEFVGFFQKINNSEKDMQYSIFELQGLTTDFLDDFFDKEKTAYKKIDSEYRSLEKERRKISAENKERLSKEKKGR